MQLTNLAVLLLSVVLPLNDPTYAFASNAGRQELKLRALEVFSSQDAPYVKLPASVGGEIGDFIAIRAETNGLEVWWAFPDKGLSIFPADLLKDSKASVVIPKLPGIYRVWAWTAIGGKSNSPSECLVIVGGVPPDPKPGPKPDPKPDPGPLPIPGEGLRVLVVYESATPLHTPNVMGATTVRGYLNSKTAKGTDGKSPEWRCWDKDINLAGADKLWQDAMTRPRQSLPWIIIANGTNGFEGPLPATVADTLALLKKFGG